MYSVSSKFQTAVKSSHTFALKVEQLDPTTLAVLATLTPIVYEGSVDVKSKDDVRRQLTLVVGNPIVSTAGLYTPAQTSDPFYMNNVLRVWRGITFQDGTTEYAPIGTFRVNRTRTRSSAGSHTVEVAAVDFTKVLQYTGLTGVTKYAGGSTVYSMFADLASRAGITRYTIDPYFQTVTLPAGSSGDLQFARATPIMDALGFLRENFGADIWFDPLGSLVVRRYVTVESQSSVWSFADTDATQDELALVWEDSVDVKNDIIAAGVSPTVQPVMAEVKDNNQNSPTYVAGPLGARLWEIDGDWITSTQIAKDVATAKLREKTYLTKQVEAVHVPYPHLDVYDVCTVTSAELRLSSALYYVNGMTIPLGNDLAKTNLLSVRALP